MYNSDSSVEYSQDSHPIGIATNDTTLNVLGSIQLKNNAKIESSSGEVSIADLSLEKGEIVINGGTLSLGGGSVGADGELEMRGQSTLKLEGDITAAGTVDIDPNSVLNFGGKTLDVSGGKLKIGGARSFDSITTNAATDLQVNTYLNMSRSCLLYTSDAADE